MAYRVKKLSCHELLLLEDEAEKLLEVYGKRGRSSEKIKAMLLNLVICYFCVVSKKGKRIFSSPLETAKKISPFEAEKISKEAIMDEENKKEEEFSEKLPFDLKTAREDGFTEMGVNEKLL